MNERCAFGDYNQQYERAGRALLPNCPKCGEPMQAKPKRTGRTWECACGHTEFEGVSK